MNQNSKQLSFVAEPETLDLIDKLKKQLGARTTAEVFRKALALTDIAADVAMEGDDGKGVVALRKRGDKPGAREVLVALRA